MRARPFPLLRISQEEQRCNTKLHDFRRNQSNALYQETHPFIALVQTVVMAESSWTNAAIHCNRRAVQGRHFDQQIVVLCVRWRASAAN